MIGESNLIKSQLSFNTHLDTKLKSKEFNKEYDSNLINLEKTTD